MHDRRANILTNLAFFVSLARLWINPRNNPLLAWYEENAFHHVVVKFYFAMPPVPSVPMTNWDTVAAMVMVDLINARFILPNYIFAGYGRSVDLLRNTIVPLIILSFLILSMFGIAAMDISGMNSRQIYLTYIFLVGFLFVVTMASMLVGSVVRLHLGITMKTNNIIYMGIGGYFIIAFLLIPATTLINWIVELNIPWLFNLTAVTFVVIPILIGCRMIRFVYDLIDRKRMVA